MKMNESCADRGVRVAVGVIALIVAFVALGAMDANILGIIGGIMVLTGAIGYCPAYSLVGLSTCKKKQCCGCGTGSCNSETKAE